MGPRSPEQALTGNDAVRVQTPDQHAPFAEQGNNSSRDGVKYHSSPEQKRNYSPAIRPDHHKSPKMPVEASPKVKQPFLKDQRHHSDEYGVASRQNEQNGQYAIQTNHQYSAPQDQMQPHGLLYQDLVDQIQFLSLRLEKLESIVSNLLDSDREMPRVESVCGDIIERIQERIRETEMKL